MDYDLMIQYSLGVESLYEYILKITKKINLEVRKLLENENVYVIDCKYLFTMGIDKNFFMCRSYSKAYGVDVNQRIIFSILSTPPDTHILNLFKILSCFLADFDTDLILFNEGTVGIIKRENGKVTFNNYENYFYPLEELGCEYQIVTNRD
jgi:hypothetical protein